MVVAKQNSFDLSTAPQMRDTRSLLISLYVYIHTLYYHLYIIYVVGSRHT